MNLLLKNMMSRRVFLFSVLSLLMGFCSQGVQAQSSSVASTSTLSPNVVDDATNPNMEGVRFGMIQIQLRSRSTSSANDLLFHVLSETGSYLDEMLANDYAQQQPAPQQKQATSVDFSHVTLAVSDFALLPTSFNGGDVQYNATIDLEGTALYFKQAVNESSLSGTNNNNSKSTILNVDMNVGQKVQAAFSDETVFLQLLKSTGNPLLSNITSALVTLDLQNNPATSPSGSAATTETNGRHSNVPVWAIAVLTAGSVILFLIALGLVYVYCSSRHKQLNQNKGIPPPIPKPSIQPTASGTSSSRQTPHVDTDGDSEKSQSHSPSPLRSITSQESSCFTYNPNSKGSNGNSFFATGSFQTNNSNIDIDVESWQKGSTIPAAEQNVPFGHDISAIDHKRDLSLIEEVDEKEIMTPEQSANRSRSIASSASSRSRHNIALTPTQRKQPHDHSRSALSERNLRELDRRRHSSHALMQDLNELSAQIDTVRGNHHSAAARTNRLSLPPGAFYLEANGGQQHAHFKLDSV